MSQAEQLAHDTRRTARIQMRLEPEVDATLRYAAVLEHKSLSAFMLDAAKSQAEQSVQRHHEIRLREAEFARVLAELDNPSRSPEPLRRMVEQAVDRVAQRRAAADLASR